MAESGKQCYCCLYPLPQITKIGDETTMKLNYPMKSNGMYILKSGDFDDIATAILKEYMPSVLDYPRAVDIDYLAQECFYLDIQHQHICIDGSILGLIAFDDTAIPVLDVMLRPSKCTLPAGTMVIDYSLSGRDNRARERFTKAHETGHWVCHRTYHSPDKQQQYEFRRAGANSYVACRTDNIERYKYKAEKTESDWEEWQADRFAASILMPKETFTQYSRDAIRNTGVRRGFLVKGEDKHKAYEAIETVAERFCVSKRATQIRMVQLGLIVEKDTYLSSFAAYC